MFNSPAFDRVRQYEAEVGYGLDPAGRPVYNAHTYASPRESAGMQQLHEKLKWEAEQEERARGDTSGAMIRELIGQMRLKNLPGNVQVELPRPHSGPSYRYVGD